MGGFAHGIDQLFDQTHAVADRSAILIRAVIVVREQELIGQIAHPGIDIEDIEACLFGAHGSLGMPADQVADIGGVHHAGPGRRHEGHMGGHPRHARGRQGSMAGGAVHGCRPAVPKLDCGKRALAMGGFCHQGVAAQIGLIPKRGAGKGAVVR